MSAAKDKNDWLNGAYFPVPYTQIYLHVARERGVDQLQLLRQAGIKAQTLTDPNARVSPQQYAQLIAAIIELSGDHGLGLEVGLRTPPTAHGHLGYALLCCGSLAEAALLIQRFRHLRGRGMLMTFVEQHDWSIVEFQSESPLEGLLRQVMFSSLVSSFYRAIQILLTEAGHAGELWFDFPQPDYFNQFRDRLPTVRFNMLSNQMRIPTEITHRPLIMSNPEALQLAVEQCERESLLFGEQPDAMLSRVRAEMVLGASGYPEPDHLAEKLHISARTFRRKLQAHGLNYKQLLEDARRRDALKLLEKPEMEIQKVAELLGYHNPANFTRAFREWTGRAPSQYRGLRRNL